ncbi:MAG: hypothetical protein KDI09_18150, partial [Halioglobus sp.]|nr:hypothetical protein [Halioglobus sp.]
MTWKTAAALTLSLAASGWTQFAVAQDAATTPPAPVEAFYCNMQPGKDMKDLMQVADRFRSWADKNDPGYSAWILTPRFGQFGELPQVVWLGSNTSGDAMGAGLDAWIASGQDIQQDFDKVVDCGSHGLASSVEVNAPDGPPGSGVVMFTRCSIAEGSDFDKVLAAHRQYSSAMRDMGAKNSNWVFVPMLGSPAHEFDYWGVSTFSSWSAYFAAYELYVRGGWQKGMEALRDVASCEQGTASVWDVKLVRAR